MEKDSKITTLEELINKHYRPVIELINEDERNQKTKHFMYLGERDFYLSIQKIEDGENGAVCAYGIDAEIFDLITTQRNIISDDEMMQRIKQIIIEKIEPLFRIVMRPNTLIKTIHGTFSELLNNEAIAGIYYNYKCKFPTSHPSNLPVPNYYLDYVE